MMSSSEFWARKLGGSAPPPHIQQPVVPSPVTPGAWWQAPAIQQGIPHQPGPVADSGMTPQETYQRLKAMRASEMNQEQMEALALLELQEQKYNHHCPNCGSDNFLPQGTRVGSQKMGTDKCFECGASSSTLTGSPEAAVGGTGGKPGQATRQVAGGAGSYGHHHSALPQQFLPRNI